MSQIGYGKREGFTIVELLIVIVVIAILATISIVAYSGIQDRAHDSAIQSDLRNFGNLVTQQKALNGTYPAVLTSALGIKFTRGAYGLDQQSKNARYCIDTSTDKFAIVAKSKSGNYYAFTSDDGLKSVPTNTYGYYVCMLIGLSTTNPQQDGLTNTTWASWVN